MEPHTSAQDVMQYDLCETAVVRMHCNTCLVNLCKACVGEHASVDLSKPHKIVHFKDRKSTPIYPGCTFHDKEGCKMYCKNCNIPICTKCIASDQHLGHNLSEISEVLDEIKDKLSKYNIELNEVIYPTYQGIASDVQNVMIQLKKEYGELSTAITKHGEDWHREIDKLVRKLKAEVDEMKNTQIQTQQKQLDEINKNIVEIKEEMKSIEQVVTSHDLSKLLSSAFDVDKFRQLPSKTMYSSSTFTLERINEEQLSKLFGILSSTSLSSETTHQKPQEAESSPPVKQLLDEPETVLTIDIKYGQLYHVACLNDDKICTIGGNSTMKVFSVNQGSLFMSIKTKSRYTPEDIAVLKSGDIVYTDYRDRTVNIVKNVNIEEVIRQRYWKPRSVCTTSSDDLLVIMENTAYKQSKVVRYSGSTQKQSIQFDDKGNPLLSFSILGIGIVVKHITENKNQDICVSDCGAGAVVVVSQAGKLRFRYTGHTPAPKNLPFSPLGITTDSQSHILTADFNNDCVHIIDQDGQFLRYIECGLSKPRGLCTDANDNLFVAQEENTQVKKIKYLK